jgi:hypothetical protein
MSYPPPPDGESPDPGYRPGEHGQPPPYGQPGYGYGQPGYGQQPPHGYPPHQDHPRALLAMILGILGLVICGPVAPFAWWIGKKAVNEIDDSGGRLGGRGMAKAGYIMGVIGTIFLVIMVLVVAVMVPVGFQSAQSG